MTLSNVYLWLFAFAVVIVLGGCRTPDIALRTHVVMSDPTSANQLLAGFYETENNQWRWTKRQFAVVFSSPAKPQATAPTLRAVFYLPASQIQKLGPITLTADVGEMSLGSETFVEPGNYIYSRVLPLNLIGHDCVSVVFTLDKALRPAEADGRELGAVVSEISLE